MSEKARNRHRPDISSISVSHGLLLPAEIRYSDTASTDRSRLLSTYANTLWGPQNFSTAGIPLARGAVSVFKRFVTVEISTTSRDLTLVAIRMTTEIGPPNFSQLRVKYFLPFFLLTLSDPGRKQRIWTRTQFHQGNPSIHPSIQSNSLQFE